MEVSIASLAKEQVTPDIKEQFEKCPTISWDITDFGGQRGNILF